MTGIPRVMEGPLPLFAFYELRRKHLRQSIAEVPFLDKSRAA
jgi:hypothetical protein